MVESRTSAEEFMGLRFCERLTREKNKNKERPEGLLNIADLLIPCGWFNLILELWMVFLKFILLRQELLPYRIFNEYCHTYKLKRSIILINDEEERIALATKKWGKKKQEKVAHRFEVDHHDICG